MKKEMVNHPDHYAPSAGSSDSKNVYEAINIIEAYDLNFSLGNTIKYILRSDKKGSQIEDLRKAAWYLNREIDRLKNLAVAIEDIQNVEW
jgi:hypothetical protein